MLSKQEIYYQLMELIVNKRSRIGKYLIVSDNIWDIIKPDLKNHPDALLRFGCWGVIIKNSDLSIIFKQAGHVYNGVGSLIGTIK